MDCTRSDPNVSCTWRHYQNQTIKVNWKSFPVYIWRDGLIYSFSHLEQSGTVFPFWTPTHLAAIIKRNKKETAEQLLKKAASSILHVTDVTDVPKIKE